MFSVASASPFRVLGYNSASPISMAACLTSFTHSKVDVLLKAYSCLMLLFGQFLHTGKKHYKAVL